MVRSVSLSLVAVVLALNHCGSSSSGGTGGTGTGTMPGPSTPACGSVGGPTCMGVSYVASKIALPKSKTDFAADIDGDGQPENGFGAVYGSLATLMIDSQSAQDMDVMAGTALVLMTESSTDATFTTDQGAATVLLTIGATQTKPDFSGNGAFVPDGTQSPGTLQGAIANGQFVSASATAAEVFPLRIPIAIGGTLTTTMPLYVTHIEVKNSGGKATSVQVDGAYKETDIDGIFLPQLAKEISAEIAKDPSSSSSMQIKQLYDTGGCMNPDGTSAKAGDGVVSPCELTQNALLKSLFAPDVQVFDANGAYAPVAKGTMKDSLSAGFSLTVVGAKL